VSIAIACTCTSSCLSYAQARYYGLDTQVVELYSSYITVLVCCPGLVLNPLSYQCQSLAHLCLLSLSLSSTPFRNQLRSTLPLARDSLAAYQQCLPRLEIHTCHACPLVYNAPSTHQVQSLRSHIAAQHLLTQNQTADLTMLLRSIQAHQSPEHVVVTISYRIY